MDYSNQEDRIRAWYSKEQTNIEAFLAGKDVHQELADRLGITRVQAKTVKHDLGYGMGIEFIKLILSEPYFFDRVKAQTERDTGSLFYLLRTLTFCAEKN